jgi:hypothetical protein
MAVFDRASGANTPGRFDQLLREARGLAGAESWAVIPHLNDLLSRLADEGSLLSWVLVFDGVFRVRLEVGSEFPEAGAALPLAPFVGGTGVHGSLECLSGEVMAASLHRLGDRALRPLVIVHPGRYHVRLRGNEEEQAKHQFLDDEASYPEGEGPDWTLYLRRM